jgi:ABC-type Fe3+-hydroxamate transport system substrate-binding protein
VSRRAVRVVSLVPSATETLLALGVTPIACTRFCEQPGIPTVGGTKDPHVDEIVALAPDLVVVNDEENRLEDFTALQRAGLPVHSMSPHSVADVGDAVTALAERVGAVAPEVLEPGRWRDHVRARQPADVRGRVAVLIWRRPWMLAGAATYGSSLLELLGWVNVLGPAADRYPEATLGEIAALAPALVLLPDEPYRFKARHADEVAAAVPAARVRMVDGRDLFWWGIRTPAALERLAAADW